MARIPQYNRSVAPQNTPYAYESANLNGDMFGVNVAQAQKRFGDAALNVADGIATLKAQYDRTKILESSNLIAKWANENLYDKDNGYFNKTGKEAMGKSPELLDSYDKYTDSLVGKSGLSIGNQQKLRSIIAEKRLGYERQIEEHDKKQSDAWQDAVFVDSINIIQSDMNKNRNNPTEMEKQLANFNVVFDNYAQIKGWDKDPETYNIKKKAGISALKASTLDAYLAEGSLKARDFFKENEQYFTPEQRNQYAAKIHLEEVNYNARTTAQNLMGMSTTEAYKYIDSIQNLDERNATENEYNRLLRHQETIQKQIDAQQSQQIMQEVYSAFENGEDVSSIMRKVNISDMSLEQKEKIYNNIKTMQELEGAGNNWADYNILLDMATYNNEEFKQINPANYSLTKEQYNKIVEMQRNASTNQYTPETEMRKQLNGFTGFNIFQTSDGLKADEYRGEVVRFLSKVERMQGKAFDFQNKQQLKAIMEGFNYKDPNAVNKNIDETKELFARAKKHGEAYDLMAREYMLFKGQNKREPSPEEIYEMAKRSYNTIENNWKKRNMGKLNNAQGVYQSVGSTRAKKGETKVLTYYADKRIPEISRELGIPLPVTSRYRAGDNGGHGKGRKVDIGVINLNGAQRARAFERLLSEPAIASIGTSDPALLKRYNNPKNPKIRDLRNYDAEYKKSHPNTTMNHINHMDISLDTRYGGDSQGR